MTAERGPAEFDLNLLRVLDALLKEGSATRAAARLGVTQPSVSLALKRLRAALGDALFVKEVNGLSPTPRALALQMPVDEILRLLQDEILTTAPFSPQTSKRTFVFVMGEIAQLLYLERIFSQVRQHAPGVKVKVVSATSREGQGVLDASGADLAIGYFPSMRQPSHYQQRLYESQLVCVTCKHHPRIGNALDLATLARLEHVILGGSDIYFSLYDRAARAEGVLSRLALEVPNLAAAPAVLAGSELVAIVPEALARHWSEQTAIAVHRLPLKVPGVGVKQYWHRRHKTDPAHQWLRQMIYQLLQRPRSQSRQAVEKT